ncbi:MAG: hypothetical protein J4F31_04430 [Flavobacteriales bacterium]|nr:hypothetical protein [Flavobacteriales bacterium]
MQKIMLLICVAALVSSCSKDVGVIDPTWTRVVGDRMNSYLRDVERFDDGRMVAVGQNGYPAYTSESSGGIVVTGKSEERGGAIYLFNAEGHLLKKGFFRTEDVNLLHGLEFYELGDKAMFWDVLPTSDNGFIVLGEWRNFSWYYQSLDTVFPANPSTSVPFICKFDAHLELTNFWSVTGSVGSPPFVYWRKFN